MRKLARCRRLSKVFVLRRNIQNLLNVLEMILLVAVLFGLLTLAAYSVGD
jgi:hypothetical protein